LANRHRQQALDLCREVLPGPPARPKPPKTDWCERLQSLTGIDPRQCEVCGEKALRRIGKLAPSRAGRAIVPLCWTGVAVEEPSNPYNGAPYRYDSNVVGGQVSASTQTQALCALLFLYRNVLDREVGEEVKRILSSIEGAERLFFSLLYGTRMRLMEARRP
jgi:hypothetical protein